MRWREGKGRRSLLSLALRLTLLISVRCGRRTVSIRLALSLWLDIGLTLLDPIRWRRTDPDPLSLLLRPDLGTTLLISVGWTVSISLSLPLWFRLGFGLTLLVPVCWRRRRRRRRTFILLSLPLSAFKNVLDVARELHPVRSSYSSATLSTG
jgi:hypothetical protein